MMSGIYKITNLKNNKIYIGSSININRRIVEHKRKLRKNIHHSPKLQNAYNKYGSENFHFESIEFCERNNLINRENYYLKILNPEYNISLDASAPMMGRKHSKSTIKKLSKWKRPKGKKHHLYGISLSKTHIKRIVKSRSWYKHTNKTKEKMRKINIRINRYKDLIKYTKLLRKPVKDSIGNKFISLTKAAEFHSMSIQSVCDILKKRTYCNKHWIRFFYC